MNNEMHMLRVFDHLTAYHVSQHVNIWEIAINVLLQILNSIATVAMPLMSVRNGMIICSSRSNGSLLLSEHI